ncbi:class I SAM-dependent methyltransferase [Methylobacillus arboreus]|uniref:class I SAM-dependent methyltransferase n=1 Tax=Methylobacillus arboreus TaxID=755170 RepID=UPI001E46B1CD|nr:class I SAM-dependent methyltransferase [Methylobacillus arboreus]MCB5190187.1 class I SAM-dependent methyltransferase [Methylobacillus arboreus]
MWDERYDTETYVYGKTANTFLVDHFRAIPQGRVLSIAEGEGRNAVFLARQGYAVTAVDGSAVGLEKAGKLARENGVTIESIHADLASFDFGEQQWDGIVSIFCPMPSALKAVVFPKIIKGLKPCGMFLLEAYTPEQLEYGTGGGKDTDAMMTKAILSRALHGFNFHRLQEVEREVVEGAYHTGLASVVQAIAAKPNNI